MTHQALKRRFPWLPERGALRRPLPWLIALALIAVLGGVGMIARIALDLASPDIVRYGGNLLARGGADYSFWPIGPLIPPLNPEAIAAAEAEQLPPPPDPSGPQDNVPIVVVGASTVIPTVATAEPSPSPTPTATETLAPATPLPATPSPLPSPTRTVVVQRAPATIPLLPTSTAAPSVTPAAPSATPVTAPEPPRAPSATQPPAPSATQPPPAPTRTTAPTQTPVPSVPTTPVPPAPPPSATPVPPTPTPEPPLLRLASPELTVSEAEGSVKVTVELSLSNGYAKSVTVAYATGDGSATANVDYTPVNGTLTFLPGERSKTFNIAVRDDGLKETNERFQLTLSNLTNAVLDGPSVATVTITDSDAPPVVRFASAARTVDESVGPVAATIELSTPSAIDISVPYTVQGYSVPGTASLSDHTLRAGTLFIPAGATSVRLRFDIVDDRIDEDQETISLFLGTPTNAQLGNPSIYTLTVNDNDTAGVAIAPQQFSLSEGGASASYSVVLESQPVANVTINLSPNRELAVQPAQLVFTPANWSTPQTIRLTVVDDKIDEDGDGNLTPHTGRVAHLVSSADPKYNALADIDPVLATIRDNDSAGVIVAPKTLALSEPPAALTHRSSYGVRLTSEPVFPVTIKIAELAGNSQVMVSPKNLTFTAANWNVDQTVTVTAIDDDVDETNPHSTSTTHTVTSTDRNYNNFPVGPVLIDITDDDTAGVEILPTILNLTEAASNRTGTYTVRLKSQPIATVTLVIAPDAPNVQVTASRASLTFTPGNWNVAQTVTVTAIDDDVDEDGDRNGTPHTSVVRHSLVSADPNYGPARPPRPFPLDDAAVSIADDDNAGVLITPTTLTVVEGSITSYTVRLTSQPTATVTLTITTLDAKIAVIPASLTFTDDTGNLGGWNLTQTVTITAQDNFIDEDVNTTPYITSTVSHSVTSVDPNYNPPLAVGFPLADVIVNLRDNDTAGVLITPTLLNLSEGVPALTATYSVRLTSQPTADVTLTISTDLAQLSSDKPTLLFTTANWATAQDVTLTVKPDDIDEDGNNNATSHISIVSHDLNSADPNYDDPTAPFTVGTVAVQITDNDTADVLVAPATLALSEGLAGVTSATVQVELTSEPTAPVTLTLTPDAQLTADQPFLLFTPGNWDTPQPVTLTAVDDFIDEDGDGDATLHVGAVAFAATSPDVLYNRSFPAYTVDIADDDTADVLVMPAALALSETITDANHTGTYAVRLLSQPVAAVMITLGLDSTQLDVSTAALVFTPATWNITQTVTVTAIDDALFEGPQTLTITQTPTTADAIYAALAIPPVTVAITDNEPALASVGDPAAIDEGDAGVRTLSFPVTLRRPATVEVTLTYTTFDLSASAGSDFVATMGTVLLAPGVVTASIDVSVMGDTTYEPDELFELRLTGIAATGDLVGLDDAQAVGTIRNDDSSAFAAFTFLSTAGPLVAPDRGYGYTGSGSNYLQVAVPCSWPLGQPVTIELWSAAIHNDPGSIDAIMDPTILVAPDTTSFELYDAGTAVALDGLTPAPGAPGSLFASTFNPTPALENWEVFFTLANPQPCGRYLLRSATSEDDENIWAVRVTAAVADQVAFGALLSTVEQGSPAGQQLCTTAWVAVPAGVTELRLRNFDLDVPAPLGDDPLALIRYYAPGEPLDPQGLLGGLAGTGAPDASWREDRIAGPAEGWWRAVICTSGRNRFSFEASADGALLAVRYDPPASP